MLKYGIWKPPEITLQLIFSYLTVVLGWLTILGYCDTKHIQPRTLDPMKFNVKLISPVLLGYLFLIGRKIMLMYNCNEFTVTIVSTSFCLNVSSLNNLIIQSILLRYGSWLLLLNICILPDCCR